MRFGLFSKKGPEETRKVQLNMKYEMIETFFKDPSDYMRFFLKLKEAKRATSDFE